MVSLKLKLYLPRDNSELLMPGDQQARKGGPELAGEVTFAGLGEERLEWMVEKDDECH